MQTTWHDRHACIYTTTNIVARKVLMMTSCEMSKCVIFPKFLLRTKKCWFKGNLLAWCILLYWSILLFFGDLQFEKKLGWVLCVPPFTFPSPRIIRFEYNFLHEVEPTRAHNTISTFLHTIFLSICWKESKREIKRWNTVNITRLGYIDFYARIWRKLYQFFMFFSNLMHGLLGQAEHFMLRRLYLQRTSNLHCSMVICPLYINKSSLYFVR